MKVLLIIFGLILPICYQLMAQNVIEFTNGHIFNGKDFVKKNFYSISGTISFKKTTQLDSTIDLSGKYIIPPFGDAHTHNLDREWQMGFLPDQYLREGTFYVLNLTSKLDGVKKLASVFTEPSTVDVRFSHQGLTSTLGHPFMAYEPFAMGINSNDWEKRMDEIIRSRLDENNSYIFVDNKSDANKNLPLFFEEKPDVVKIFLLFSDEYNQRRASGNPGQHGLSPEIAKLITDESHKRGLKVYAHIETLYDFKLGIDIGVDYFAHMPGYNWDGNRETYNEYYSDDELMKRAIKKEIGIIPTLSQALSFSSKDSLAKLNFVKDFCERYYRFGGSIIAGSDVFNQTLSQELDHFINLGIFDNLTLLRIFCIDTPQSIFPDRKIGELKEGYETNFIVLNNNPIKNIRAISEIHLRVKQGIVVLNQ